MHHQIYSGDRINILPLVVACTPYPCAPVPRAPKVHRGKGVQVHWGDRPWRRGEITVGNPVTFGESEGAIAEGNRREPQGTAGNCREPQGTAGNRREPQAKGVN